MNKSATDTGFTIDFLSGKMRYRAEKASLRNELLARAIGAKPSAHPSIVDATAGLGRDSFILATLGFEVTMLERSDVLHEKLADALQRARTLVPEVITRLTLVHTEAVSWLNALPINQRPEVIYLDPMFPERKKSASIKKEMAFMQELLGTCRDQEILFSTAMACAKKRVVVKRPKHAGNISEKAPNFCYRGRSSRFDVYLT